MQPTLDRKLADTRPPLYWCTNPQVDRGIDRCVGHVSVTCQQSVSDLPAKYWPTIDQLLTEQALQGTLATRRKKEGELATASLEFDFHLQFPRAPRWLSCQISPNQCKVETNANVNKHWKTCAKGNDIIANAISPNQHFASTFSMQIFKFQRCSYKLSFLFPPPPEHPRELAQRLVVANCHQTHWLKLNRLSTDTRPTLGRVLNNSRPK